MHILCLFCNNVHGCKKLSPEGCKDKVISGTFTCPYNYKYQHINCCIKRVEKPHNRSRECNKRCPIYQERETILFWMNPPKMVKLEKKR